MATALEFYKDLRQVSQPAAAVADLESEGIQVVETTDAMGMVERTLYFDGAPIVGAMASGGGLTIHSTEDASPVTARATIDFLNIPSTANIIILSFNLIAIGGGGTSWQIQIGDSGGIETDGYKSTSLRFENGGGGAAVEVADSFVIRTNDPNDIYNGQMILTRTSMTNRRTWVSTHNISADDNDAREGTGGTAHAINNLIGTGGKTLTGDLTQVRVKSADGSNFDSTNATITLAYA